MLEVKSQITEPPPQKKKQNLPLKKNSIVILLPYHRISQTVQTVLLQFLAAKIQPPVALTCLALQVLVCEHACAMYNKAGHQNTH